MYFVAVSTRTVARRGGCVSRQDDRQAWGVGERERKRERAETPSALQRVSFLALNACPVCLSFCLSLSLQADVCSSQPSARRRKKEKYEQIKADLSSIERQKVLKCVLKKISPSKLTGIRKDFYAKQNQLALDQVTKNNVPRRLLCFFFFFFSQTIELPFLSFFASCNPCYEEDLLAKEIESSQSQAKQRN